MTPPGLPQVAHLVVPTWGADPALDRHTQALGAALHAAGVDSILFARELVGRPAVSPVSADEVDVRAVSALQGSMPSPSGLAVLIVRITPEGWRDPIPGPAGAPVVLDCHRFFHPGDVAAWDPAAARRMAATLDEIDAIRARTVLAIADCDVAAGLLRRIGFHRTVVVPALDGGVGAVEPDVRMLRRLGAQGRAPTAPNWTVLGGVHPLSRIDHLIAAVWATQRYLGLDVWLHVVGGIEDVPYARALRALAARLGVARRVRFAGAVTPAQESAYLEAADLVCDLSTSGRSAAGARAALERRRPVVAVRGGTAHAVVDGAGLLVGPGALMATARSADRVHADPVVRRLLEDAAGLRCAELDPARAGAAQVDLLAQALAAA